MRLGPTTRSCAPSCTFTPSPPPGRDRHIKADRARASLREVHERGVRPSRADHAHVVDRARAGVGHAHDRRRRAYGRRRRRRRMHRRALDPPRSQAHEAHDEATRQKHAPYTRGRAPRPHRAHRTAPARRYQHRAAPRPAALGRFQAVLPPIAIHQHDQSRLPRARHLSTVRRLPTARRRSAGRRRRTAGPHLGEHGSREDRGEQDRYAQAEREHQQVRVGDGAQAGEAAASPSSGTNVLLATARGHRSSSCRVTLWRSNGWTT